MEFDKDHIPEKRLKAVQRFTKLDDFNATTMSKSSAAAAALCVWVKAIEEYAQALKVVIPKREKKEAAEAKVKAMEEALAEMEKKFNEMMAEVEELEMAYKIIMDQME